MALHVVTRRLARAEPHVPILTGPYSPGHGREAEKHDQGTFQIVSIRQGLTISAFDIRSPSVGMETVQTRPCVALYVLLEAAGETHFDSPTTTTDTALLRPGFYCMISPNGTSGANLMRNGSRLRGIDIRLSPDLWRALNELPFDTCTPQHPLHFTSTDGTWSGALPLSSETLSEARALFDDITAGGNDLRLELRALNLISTAITLLDRKEERPTVRSRDPKAVDKVIDLISADLCHDWTVGELAAQAGISAKRLKQVFPPETGLPVYSYLQEQRLVAANHMIVREGCSVTEAAFAVGYSSSATSPPFSGVATGTARPGSLDGRHEPDRTASLHTLRAGQPDIGHAAGAAPQHPCRCDADHAGARAGA